MAHAADDPRRQWPEVIGLSAQPTQRHPRGLLSEVAGVVDTSLLTLAPQPRWIVKATRNASQLEKGIGLIAPDGGTASSSTVCSRPSIARLKTRPASFRLSWSLPARSTVMTGGRYEGIFAATRLDTLLPEIGAQIAKSAAKQSYQHRLTYEPRSSQKPAPGKRGRSPFEILGIPNEQLPDGSSLWINDALEPGKK
jgi:hypothetical protein